MVSDDDGLPPFEAIGFVRCSASCVEDVPSEGLPSSVVLKDRYLEALTGVEPGDHLYVVAVFHQADPRVLTGSPGTPNVQGAFSIRSSCRPNLIGMTLSTVVGIDGPEVTFEWLDFVDGSPVLDLKRYNWRWECVPSARRLDRRFIEQQISRDALATVLARPAYNFHGERCHRVGQIGELGARLVQDFNVWLGSPTLAVSVRGDGHLVDCVQGLTGATFGNDRLAVTLADRAEPWIELRDESLSLTAQFNGCGWDIHIS
jgi:tRNA (Thr-GGU) A37 N-methylase